MHYCISNKNKNILPGCYSPPSNQHHGGPFNILNVPTLVIPHPWPMSQPMFPAEVDTMYENYTRLCVSFLKSRGHSTI